MSTIPISPPRPVSESDVVKAYERDIEQSKKYEELRVDDPEIALQARRKRLMYRARQRGWLEVDLVLGSWAHKHVPELSEQGLQEFEAILKLETMDVFEWLTGRAAVPEEVDSAVFRSVCEFAKSSPVGRADPDAYAEVKKVMSN